MAQSRTRFVGMDVHKAALAVVSVAHDHGAEAASLGTMGTRQCAIDPLLPTRPSPTAPGTTTDNHPGHPYQLVQKTERHGPLNAEGFLRASAETQLPVWCHPRRRQEACQGYACLERGRPPTEGRKVVTNPRRAAGSTVVSSWLRLLGGTKGKQHQEDLKKVALNP